MKETKICLALDYSTSEIAVLTFHAEFNIGNDILFFLTFVHLFFQMKFS